LAPAAPGYREIVVRPVPGPGLTSAAASLDTPYGPAAVAWERDRDRFRLDVTVPPGTRATVHLPGGDPHEVGPGTHHWELADPVPAWPRVRTVRDAFDHPALWHHLTEVAVEHGVAADAAAFAGRAARFLDHPVSALPAAMAFGPDPGDPDKTTAAFTAVLARYT
jgi:alpha-L-rhamnosidase